MLQNQQFPLSALTQVQRKEEMFTIGNFSGISSKPSSLPLPPLHNFCPKHFQLLRLPKIMQFLISVIFICLLLCVECSSYLPPQQIPIVCFILFHFFLSSLHPILSGNKLQFSFGKQHLPLFIHMAQVWLTQSFTYSPRRS